MSGTQSPTPSLIGASVRDIGDTGNNDFKSMKAVELDEASRLLKRDSYVASLQVSNKLTSPPALRDEYYTSVDDLNKEGALLTDEVDMDNIDTTKVESKKDDLKAERDRKKLLFLQKQQRKIDSESEHSNIYSNYTGSRSHSHLHLVDDEESINGKSFSSGDLAKLKNEDDKESSEKRDESDYMSHEDEQNENEEIKNSYGQVFKNESSRPHLARGDSYQSTHLDRERFPNESLDVPHGRPGRSYERKLSPEYLRSLSRSLNRDPNNPKNLSIPSSSLDDVMALSTNNYSISLASLEPNSQVTEEPLQEEKEEGIEIQNRYEKDLAKTTASIGEL